MCSGVGELLFASAFGLGKGPAINCLEDSPLLPVICSHANASLSSLEANLKTVA